MKGLVFTEFMDMVDQAFSVEVCENLIDMSNLPSKGVYTSVGRIPTRVATRRKNCVPELFIYSSAGPRLF